MEIDTCVVICPVCGKEFESRKNPKLTPKKFCSKKCRGLHNQKNYWLKKLKG